jgi:hypothetical protein
VSPDLDRSSWVRVGLRDLPALNKHHDFEHLCRAVARVCLKINVIPSTGPVGSGGDQGRDFESYPLGPGNTVGACTRAREKDLQSKIILDVQQIMTKGDPPGRIVVFLSRAFAKGKRHKVEEDCRARFGIAPEIYDGPAIAEMIAPHDDLMKLAVKYLDLPSTAVSGAEPPRAEVVADRATLQTTPDCRAFIDDRVARRAAECWTSPPEPGGAGGDSIEENNAALADILVTGVAWFRQIHRTFPEDGRGRGDLEAFRSLVGDSFGLVVSRLRNGLAPVPDSSGPVGLNDSDIAAHLEEYRAALWRRAQLLAVRNAGSQLPLRVVNAGGADLPGAVVRLSLPVGAVAVPAQVAADPGPALPARPTSKAAHGDSRSAHIDRMIAENMALFRSLGHVFPPEQPTDAYHATGDLTDGGTVAFPPVDLPAGASVLLPAIPVMTHHNADGCLTVKWTVDSPLAEEPFTGILPIQLAESILRPEDLLKGHPTGPGAE